MSEIKLEPITTLTKVSLSIPPSVLAQDLDGEVVLLDTLSGQYYGLDEVGSRMWHLIEDHGSDVSTVVEALVKDYSVESERLQSDLSDFARMLEHFGLLAISRAAAD